MAKIKNILIYALGIISMGSFILATGVKEIPNWVEVVRPFFLVGLTALAIALLIYNWNSIRRITYPAIICAWAWMYKHKLAKSKFSCHTYRVYVFFGESYKNLYCKVQDAFDQYLESAVET